MKLFYVGEFFAFMQFRLATKVIIACFLFHIAFPRISYADRRLVWPNTKTPNNDLVKDLDPDLPWNTIVMYFF